MNSNLEHLATAEELDDCRYASGEQLAAVWDAIDSPVYALVDAEGATLAHIRRFTREQWIKREGEWDFDLLAHDLVLKFPLIPVAVESLSNLPR